MDISKSIIEDGQNIVSLTLTDIFQIVFTILIAAILYYIGSSLLSQLIRKTIRPSLRHNEAHYRDIEKRRKTLADLFKSMWRVLVIIVATFLIFTTFFGNASLAPLFASAGIIGVALGLGAQSVVKDFLSGIFIVSENQYRVGDIIEIDGATGTVEQISARATVIRDADGNVHHFPNGIVQHVINKTMGYSMARFIITIHPSHNLEEVIDIINTTGKKLAHETKWKEKILEPPAFSSVNEFTTDTVSIAISGKTLPSDQWSVASEMRRRLLLEFEEKGIILNSISPPSK
ncbi:MAG TPA: mechanosensitive ion channel family protein [Candidatus Saccharimonadales bacterium]|nr:mechanosensitive ion channel family protein [Candidatus Saccharimonadales bacterium]